MTPVFSSKCFPHEKEIMFCCHEILTWKVPAALPAQPSAAHWRSWRTGQKRAGWAVLVAPGSSCWFGDLPARRLGARADCGSTMDPRLRCSHTHTTYKHQAARDTSVSVAQRGIQMVTVSSIIVQMQIQFDGCSIRAPLKWFLWKKNEVLSKWEKQVVK